MKNKRAVSFAEFRDFMSHLGYALKQVEQGSVFHQDGKDLIVLRPYQPDEEVDERDLRIARRFLDSWGYLGAAEFDAFVHQATKPA